MVVMTTVQDVIDRDGTGEDNEQEATPGTKVDVYRNLQKGGLSIRSRETNSYGLVIDHDEKVILEDVEFVVNESGRQKVLEEGVKNVHAFARGIIAKEKNDLSDPTEVTYNPFEYESFVSKEDERPVDNADFVVLCADGVFAYNPTFE